jgi:hypothetical protein
MRLNPQDAFLYEFLLDAVRLIMKFVEAALKKGKSQKILQVSVAGKKSTGYSDSFLSVATSLPSKASDALWLVTYK